MISVKQIPNKTIYVMISVLTYDYIFIDTKKITAPNILPNNTCRDNFPYSTFDSYVKNALLPSAEWLPVKV